MPRFRLPRVTRLLVASLITLSLGLAIWVGHPVHALPAADGLGSPLSVMVSPDGAHAYVASIGDRVSLAKTRQARRGQSQPSRASAHTSHS